MKKTPSLSMSPDRQPAPPSRRSATGSSARSGSIACPRRTKLVEEKLASVFGVSRTKIRLALARLSHDGILTTEPNRGTFVSSPTIEQARQVFVARRLLEPA